MTKKILFPLWDNLYPLNYPPMRYSFLGTVCKSKIYLAIFLRYSCLVLFTLIPNTPTGNTEHSEGKNLTCYPMLLQESYVLIWQPAIILNSSVSNIPCSRICKTLRLNIWYRLSESTPFAKLITIEKGSKSHETVSLMTNQNVICNLIFLKDDLRVGSLAMQ